MRESCAARREGKETVLPIRKKPAPRKKEHRTVLILREGERVALRQRPAEGLLAGLYEPFCIMGERNADEVAEILAAAGLSVLHVGDLGTAKHIFTHLEWHLTGFEVILDEKSAETGIKTLDNGLFFAPRYEIDESFALPTAYSAYRPFM